MAIWIKVTDDKYQFPVAIADSAKELAEMCGTTPNNVSSLYSKYRAGKVKAVYLKVEIEEGEED